MKYILVEKTEDNETFMWEYNNKKCAIENIKYMRIKETEPYRTKSEIRLFKAEEIDVSSIEGYSLDEINKPQG